MRGETLRSYIILGAGGHAAVVADILYKCRYSLKGFLDDTVSIGTEVLGAKVLGKIDNCRDYIDCLFIIGIGDNHIREKIAQTYSLEYSMAVHPSAIIGQDVLIGCGSVVMAGSVINSRTRIGSHCIINTKASIDHDNKLSDFVHVSPGAVLGGSVSVGDGTHIGIGACVRNNISICAYSVIGAGAAVVKNIDESGVYMGIPAKIIKDKVHKITI